MLNIVLIDDDEDVREIMAMSLEVKAGATINSFSNTDSAYEFLNSETKIKPSLIICDYKLPGEDGLSFYKRVKTLKIPFVLLTGMMFDKDDVRYNAFTQEKLNMVVFKPVDFDSFTMQINDLVQTS